MPFRDNVFSLVKKQSYTQSLQTYVPWEHVFSKTLSLSSMSLGSHSARYEISTEYVCILIYDKHPNRIACAHLYL